MGTPLLWSLPPAASAAAAARQLFRQLCSSLPPGVLDDALVLVSEVVTNAVRHGQGPVTFAVTPGAHRVRVEVTDASPAPPRPRLGELEAESGRGLHIVDVLASRWGTTPAARAGKTVWFELDLPEDAGRGAAG